jgi:hypothetical protein
MTIKIDNQEPNIFSLVEGIDVRDAGRTAEGPVGDRDHSVELCASRHFGRPFGAVSEKLAIQAGIGRPGRSVSVHTSKPSRTRNVSSGLAPSSPTVAASQVSAREAILCRDSPRQSSFLAALIIAISQRGNEVCN